MDVMDKIRNKQNFIVWSIIGIVYVIIWLFPYILPDLMFDLAEKPTETLVAENILRDISFFKWYIIPIFLIVLYLYFEQIERKNFGCIMAGLAFWLMDWFNEIWNGFFYSATKGYGAVWMTSDQTAYQILIGLNVEITFMFAIMGLMSTKILPKDKNKMIWKLNNRHVYAMGMALLCVIVEIILNLIGALPWVYTWWNWYMPIFIFIVGYLPFYEIAYWVYDLPNLKSQIKVVILMSVFVILCLAIGIPLGLL